VYELFHGLGQRGSDRVHQHIATVDVAVEAGVEQLVLLAVRASSEIPQLCAASRDAVIAPRSQELSRRKESQLQQTVMQSRA
jgi:hypothetical protein